MTRIIPKSVRQLTWCLTLCAASGLGAQMLSPSQAFACPDCAFPTARGVWIRTDGIYEIEIQRSDSVARGNEVRVTIRDLSTGQVLARGTRTFTSAWQSNFEVDMVDDRGNPFEATISSFDVDGTDPIEVQVECNTLGVH